VSAFRRIKHRFTNKRFIDVSLQRNREWRKHGIAAAQLGCLLNGAGYFHSAHRAMDHRHALLEILAHELPLPALAL
jgi:hypothetical protein